MHERSIRSVAVIAFGLVALTGCTAAEPAASDPPPSDGAERIAYSLGEAPDSRRPALWTINPDGSDAQPVGDQLGQYPDWSPDRTHLVFDYFGDDGRVHIGRIAPDGTGFAQLTDDVFSGEPDYAPDASTIVLSKSPVADEYAPGFTTTLWLMDADGSNARLLLAPAEAGFDYEGEYSPDGSEIAFTRYDPATDTSAIFVVRPDGSGLRQATAFDTVVEHPRWSPDGETLIYNIQFSADLDDPRNGIWVVPATGGDPTRLLASTPERHVIKPDYSRDGERIAFGCFFRDEDNEDLCVMDADGGSVERITDTRGFENYPVWD